MSYASQNYGHQDWIASGAITRCVPLCGADYNRPRPAPWWHHEKECPVRVAAEIDRGKREVVEE